MNRILIILSVFLLASCSDSLDIKLESEVRVFLSNDSNKEITLTSKDKEYMDINEWLGEHNSGWYSTSGRYPGGVYIKSGSDGIQVTETHVVIYSTTSSEPKAIYIQEADKGELSVIRELGK